MDSLPTKVGKNQKDRPFLNQIYVKRYKHPRIAPGSTAYKLTPPLACGACCGVNDGGGPEGTLDGGRTPPGSEGKPGPWDGGPPGPGNPGLPNGGPPCPGKPGIPNCGPPRPGKPGMSKGEESLSEKGKPGN